MNMHSGTFQLLHKELYYLQYNAGNLMGICTKTLNSFSDCCFWRYTIFSRTHFVRVVYSLLMTKVNENLLVSLSLFVFIQGAIYTSVCKRGSVTAGQNFYLLYSFLSPALCFGTYTFTSVCQFVQVGSSHLARSRLCYHQFNSQERQTRISLDYIN